MSDPLESALSKFQTEFGVEPDFKAFAPGRVNLIGEHVDYNDGFVLPFALDFRTVVVGSIAPEGSTSRVVTTATGLDPVSFDATAPNKEAPEWANYVKGTISQYKDFLSAGFALNLAISSTVPLGSGLSSSASLEVAVATLLEAMLESKGISWTPTGGVAKALRCQKAEHEWADTPCGIMDQYISAMGVSGKLLLIDCRSTEYTLVPMGDENATDSKPVMLIANTNVKHNLSGSEYPDRVRQCREAVATMKERGFDIRATRDATLDMLEKSKEAMSDVNYRRARHCITEDARTLSCVAALGKGEWSEVGKHMSASHVSLRDDFEVSCPELDALQRLALEVPGVYGSRMTGGGFGGCTITLVAAEALETLQTHLKEKYPTVCPGYECSLYVSTPSAGSGMY